MPFSAIIDRTWSDIDNRTAKAFLNASDLNRIETNCSILAGLLKITSLTIKTDWIRTDSITPNGISRILGNIKALRDSYYTYDSTPALPNSILYFQDLNDAETILLDAYNLFLINDRAKYYAGELYSGENMGVI